MKTCKKLGKILLCAGMLTAAAAIPAFAADAQTQTEPNVTFTVDKTEVAVGDTVTVTISNKEATLAGIGFYLSFDMPELKCITVDKDAADTKFKADPNKDAVLNDDVTSDGIYSYGVAKAENATYAAGDIVTLTFEATQVGTANLVLMENSATTDKAIGFKGKAKTQEINIVEAFDDEFTVGGNITSYLVADGEVTVELFKDGAETAAYTETTTTGVYSIENVATGSYTMKVSKANHATREYAVSVIDGVVAQDVKICPIGDADCNGRVNIRDWNAVKAHNNETTLLTDYAFKCGDADGNNRVNIRDWNAIKAHMNETKPLW